MMNPEHNPQQDQPAQVPTEQPQWTPPVTEPVAPQGTNESSAPESPVKKSRRPRKRVVLIAAAALVVVGLIVLLLTVLGGKHADQSQLDNVVDYDNSGYTTETVVPISDGKFASTNLLIAPNTRVNIENRDDADHWITTTDPDQTDGPATDEENDPRLPHGVKIFGNGGYAHVFEKPGTYSFHLTDQPTNLTIVVK